MKLTMSDVERDALRVMEQLQRGELSQGDAAERLGCTVRQVRRRLRRYEAEGDAGLVHRSRGRASNRRVPEAIRQRVVEALRERYSGFGPTLASEKLSEYEGIAVSRETVRQWMIEEGLWEARAPRRVHRRRRPRRACFGELVQMDTSEHDWFEGRSEQEAVLITMVDDATSRVLMRFFASDTTEANMTMLRAYIRRFGRPMALYADRASHFVTTRGASVEEQLEGRGPETQIGRALRELGIEQIRAHSPQAKGRVERSFGTAQDRLVKELRLEGVSSIEQANEYLERVFVPRYNDKFAVPAACAADAHRPIEGYDLDAIFSHQETRTVRNDHTIQYYNVVYQLAAGRETPRLRRAKVVVELRLDETIRVRLNGHYLPCSVIAPAACAPQEQGASKRPRRRSQATRQPYTPPPDHPWRTSFARWFARSKAGRQ